MENNDYIKVIEKINEDYLEIINSKEYNLGRKIFGLKDKNILYFFNRIKRKVLLRNIEESKQQYNWTEKEKQKLMETNNNNNKIVVYSCITGNYDKDRQPYYYSKNIDYIMYTDNETHGWIKKQIPDNIRKLNDSILINRYIKFHPHELFADKYDYSIYVDGNITIISDISVLTELINKKYGFAFHKHYSRKCVYDEAKYCIVLKKGNKKNIKKQVNRYKESKFPKKYGLLEGNVIVNDLKNKIAKKIMEEIWKELTVSQTFRDQLVIPYVLWKNKIKVEDVGTLGRNVYKNPKIRIERHS